MLEQFLNYVEPAKVGLTKFFETWAEQLQEYAQTVSGSSNSSESDDTEDAQGAQGATDAE